MQIDTKYLKGTLTPIFHSKLLSNQLFLLYPQKLEITDFTTSENIPFDRFGWFYDRNGSESYDGLFEMFTGERLFPVAKIGSDSIDASIDASSYKMVACPFIGRENAAHAVKKRDAKQNIRAPPPHA